MKKKILFIDRDGTLIEEPLSDFQIDSLEKLQFIPKVIRNLYKIKMLNNYEFVMVSNQDGLGSVGYPQQQFDIVQEKLLTTFKNEDIDFENTHIDVSYEYENKPTRKPGISMLTRYFTDGYNLSDSFVIGDRITDILLAKNLGCKAIFLRNLGNNNEVIPTELESYLAMDAKDWDEIYRFIRFGYRKCALTRKTNETEVFVSMNLDGNSVGNISTGLHFFDHMLDQIRTHAGVDLSISCIGDLNVDEHHTIEDTAIVLGEAFYKTLDNKSGINRYGFYLPMDDSLAKVAIDFGGRPWIEWNVLFKREKIGDMPTEMFYHFFKTFSDHAKCNINIVASGINEHHLIEGIFKAFARAIKQAIHYSPENSKTPSSKGLF